MASIEAIDMYYLKMPTVERVADGSQDVLLVRVQAGQYEGWGECEASPVVSIASLVTPMSHSACQPVADSVLGQRLDSLQDVRRISAMVRANSYDQLQAAHTLSGIEIAMCDLLGRRYEVPVYNLLGIQQSQPRTPYASVLFGLDPHQTYLRAQHLNSLGYTAAKFGWSGFGAADVEHDRAQIAAAREGLGPDAVLMVDAGMAWLTEPAQAIERIAAMAEFDVRLLEEPFIPEAYHAYTALRAQAPASLMIAGGEGCHNVQMAASMLESAELDCIQIDAGRIGGITAARDVAELAATTGKVYINHTFTSHLALSASLHPYADHHAGSFCEYPIDPKPVAADLTTTKIERDPDGMIRLPEAPGLGLEPNPHTIEKYLCTVEINVQGETLFTTPALPQRNPTQATGGTS